MVWLFAAALSVLAALAAGLIPALSTSRAELLTVIRRAGGAVGAIRGKRRVRGALAIIQVALSLVLVLALWLTRAIASQLYGVTPTDPPTLIAAAALLLTTVLVATFVPALRVTRVDPMTALRYE
jgi:putative ABC transport system permease protein